MGSFLSGLFSGLGFPSAIPGIGAITDVGAALIGFFSTITDYRMWRSLAWLLLGVASIIGGIVLWAKTRAAGL